MDLYEYMLGKIPPAGLNGRFRTRRHIVRLMVEMVAPKADGYGLRPRLRYLWCVSDIQKRSTTQSFGSTFIMVFSMASISTTPCWASAA
jgi:hypothetical protein